MGETLKRLRYVRSFMRKGLVHLNLQIMYQCNFRCKICDFWKKEYRKMPKLSAAQVEIISEKLRPLGPLIVSVGGGEPMLHRELPQMIKALAKHHFPVMICNGWFMTPEKARELFAAGMHEISISVDYASAEKHDEQRGRPGAFERALKALEYLQQNRTDPSQRVHMISVVMDDNIDEIEPLIKLAKEVGVSYLVTLYSDQRGVKENKASRGDITARLLDLHKRYPSFVALRGYLGRFTEAVETGIDPCYAGKNLFNIDCQGNVSRCIDQLDQPAGNILTDNVEDIRRTLLGQFENNQCSDCWTSCRGNYETLLYGKDRLQNLIDSYRITRNIPLGRSACIS
jgi:MoaA/NifB/PqqE/SkfB family radical SAM enzyme